MISLAIQQNIFFPLWEQKILKQHLNLCIKIRNKNASIYCIQEKEQLLKRAT